MLELLAKFSGLARSGFPDFCYSEDVGSRCSHERSQKQRRCWYSRLETSLENRKELEGFCHIIEKPIADPNVRIVVMMGSKVR